jgi:hypothetical protein
MTYELLSADGYEHYHLVGVEIVACPEVNTRLEE